MTQYAQETALNAAGRFGRFSYLAWNCLLAIVASIILGIFFAIFPNTFVNLETGNFGGGMIFIILIYVALMYFTFVFTIRRLHDRNHTGWLSLLMLVPLANVILMLALILVDWQLAIVALFLANFIGCLIVIPLLLSKKLTRSSHVPFGPMLIAGTVAAWFIGWPLLDAYLLTVGI